METKTRVPKIEKNWQIKDRTYILTGGKSPLSWTIQSKHTARKPLLWFDEEVPKHQQSLQKLLSLYHPKAGELWEEIDEEVIAKDEVDNIEFELEALNLVRTLDIEHLEAIMRTELGSTVSTLSSKELKRDAYNFAKNDPKLFIELSKDDDIKLRNLANRAVEVGILQLTDDNTVFRFANGKKVMTVPFDQHPYGALAQYFKTDEGVDLMKSITKKLS